MSYIDFHCNIDILDNPLNLEVKDYLEIAVRKNKKRKFLFVSKNLGKHLPCKPYKVDELGDLLVRAFKEKYINYKDDKQVVLGFAETATCLAHSFFDRLETAEFLINTTRELVNERDSINFEEEHSHAVEQILYIDKLNEISDINTFVLIDDEITTAKTCINIIRKLNEKYNVKKYVIASLLNWIDKERMREIKDIAQSLQCEIEFVYLFNGKFNFNIDNDNVEDELLEKFIGRGNIEVVNLDLKLNSYMKYTGRFGITRAEHEALKSKVREYGKELERIRSYHNILCIGVEEFMYIPMLFSKELKGNVHYHSITRSPIVSSKQLEYPIKSKYKLKSFNNDNINYLYNLDVNYYEECYLFLEQCKDEERINEFINMIDSLGLKKINIIRC